jgi:hypothetical protein
MYDVGRESVFWGDFVRPKNAYDDLAELQIVTERSQIPRFFVSVGQKSKYRPICVDPDLRRLLAKPLLARLHSEYFGCYW